MKDLSLHLLDIIQNSISAKADKIQVAITANKFSDRLEVTINDNGAGMDKELLDQITNPFVTTRNTRRVGLGIPLLEASAQRSSGDLSVKSVKGQGTTLTAWFKISHIDRLPLGDIAETLTTLVASNPEVEVILELAGNGEFYFNSYDIKQRLGDVPITHYDVLAWIREFINEGVKNTFGGVLNEIIS